MPKNIRGLLAFLILTALAAAAQDMSTTVSSAMHLLGIEGHVTDTHGKPVAGLRVVIKRIGLTRDILTVGTTQEVNRHGVEKVKHLGRWQTTTNKKGIFGRYGLPRGVYKISLYQGKQLIAGMTNVDLNGGYAGGPILVNFRLKKHKSSPLAAAAAPSRNPNLYLARGRTLIQAGRLHQADVEYRQAARINPAQAGVAFYDEGVALLQAKHARSAGAVFQHAAQLNPQNPQMW